MSLRLRRETAGASCRLDLLVFYLEVLDLPAETLHALLALPQLPNFCLQLLQP